MHKEIALTPEGQAQARGRAPPPRDGSASRGRRANQGGQGVRRHLRELRVRRRQERAGVGREPHHRDQPDSRECDDHRYSQERADQGHARVPRAPSKRSTRATKHDYQIVGSAEADPAQGQDQQRVAGGSGHHGPEARRDRSGHDAARLGYRVRRQVDQALSRHVGRAARAALRSTTIRSSSAGPSSMRCVRPALSRSSMASKSPPAPHSLPSDTLSSPSGAETEDIVTIAGRLVAKRDQGKLAFLVLRDATGEIQLFCRLNVLGEARLRVGQGSRPRRLGGRDWQRSAISAW